jgi:hypothetical protein
VARTIDSPRQSCTTQPKLLETGGYAIVDTLPGEPQICGAMLREAVNAAGQAARQEHDRDQAMDRGGAPARRLFSSVGGAAQQALYSSKALLGFFGEVVGATLRPSGPQGSYSYYARTGDHLGLHRDIAACDVAVISCLCDEGAQAGSGALQLYPTRIAEPLSHIRATPDRGLVSVCLRPGQTIVLLGGYVAHATAPMAEGQKRLISVLCYRGEWASPLPRHQATWMAQGLTSGGRRGSCMQF